MVKLTYQVASTKVELAASSEDPEVPEILGIRDGWEGGCKKGKTLKGLEIIAEDVLDL